MTHVTGKILVNGEQTRGVWIRYVPISGTAETRPEYQVGIVDSGINGEFSLRTYEDKDGVPAGEYALSFSLLATSDKRPGSKNRQELLAEEFTDLQHPFKKIRVEQGTDLNLGEIALETKRISGAEQSANDKSSLREKRP